MKPDGYVTTTKPAIACDRCGVAFRPRRRDARFCGGACRQAAHAARRRDGGGRSAHPPAVLERFEFTGLHPRAVEELAHELCALVLARVRERPEHYAEAIEVHRKCERETDGCCRGGRHLSWQLREALDWLCLDPHLVNEHPEDEGEPWEPTPQEIAVAVNAGRTKLAETRAREAAAEARRTLTVQGRALA